MNKLAFILLLITPVSWAKEHLPTQINRDNILFEQCNAYTLKYALVIKIAEIGWYAPNCKESTLLNSENKILRFHYFKDVKADFFKKSAEEYFLKNLNSEQKYDDLLNDLVLFNSGYTEIKPGEYFELVHREENTLSLYRNNKLLASTENKDLAVNYFNIWFGSEPVIDKLKKAFN